MMDSATSKERGSQDFLYYYENMCALLRLCPLPSVTAFLNIQKLNFNADKISSADWDPILNALKINRSLETIVIKSSEQPTNTTNIKKSATKKKPTPIKSEEFVTKLCNSIKDCLLINCNIKVLDLKGLHLRDKHVHLLCKGLSKNKSLFELSLEGSLHGHKQLEVICQVLKNNMKLAILNLSDCSLDNQSAAILAKYVQHQSSVRHSEAWQETLRYRKPVINVFSGLKRLTINNNPLFGDSGVKTLCSALRDDIWIKALDFHNCGITDEGAQVLLEMIKINTSLGVVDVRMNDDIKTGLLRCVLEQCILNYGGRNPEFKWLSTKDLQDVEKKIKSKMTSHNRASGNGHTKRIHIEGKKQQGIPWRMAVRAARLRNVSPEWNCAKEVVYENLSNASSSTPKQQNISSHNNRIHNTKSTPNTSSNKKKSRYVTSSGKEIVDKNMEIFERIDHNKEKDEEIEQLQYQNNKLTEENNYLKTKCEELAGRQNVFHNEEFLDSIESSFQQFHLFLDMLRVLGLGPLINIAGLNQATLSLNPSLSRINETLGCGQAGGSSQQINESLLNTTDQMRSFLAERSFNVNQLSSESKSNSAGIFSNETHLANEVSKTKEYKNPSKFQEHIDQALRNGDSLLEMASVPSDVQIKDLVQNISSRMSDRNSRRHSEAHTANSNKIVEQSVVRTIQEGHRTLKDGNVDGTRHKDDAGAGDRKVSENKKIYETRKYFSSGKNPSAENNDYSSQFTHSSHSSVSSKLSSKHTATEAKGSIRDSVLLSLENQHQTTDALCRAEKTRKSNVDFDKLLSRNDNHKHSENIQEILEVENSESSMGITEEIEGSDCANDFSLASSGESGRKSRMS